VAFFVIRKIIIGYVQSSFWPHDLRFNFENILLEIGFNLFSSAFNLLSQNIYNYLICVFFAYL
ncbi:hypothetical protein ACJBT6_10635, partial [Streptococcus suis]